MHALAYHDLTACADSDLTRRGIVPAPTSPPQQQQQQPQAQPRPADARPPQLPTNAGVTAAPAVAAPVPQQQQQAQQHAVSRDDACVAALLGMLPPARLYGGPAIDTARLLAVLRQLPPAPGIGLEPPLKHTRLM